MFWQTSYYHYDGLGSTQLLTDEDANVTDNYAYTAFGEVVDTGAQNLTTNPFQYVGQHGYYLDTDTGNYYVRMRTYRPVFGRWLSNDPLGWEDVSGQGANLGSYVRNNPTSRIDPTGTKLEVGYLGFESKLDDLDCGDLAFAGFAFSFSTGGAPCVGYLVQKVEISCDIDPECKKCPTEWGKGVNFSYYEAWHFKKGDITPEAQKESLSDTASFKATDSWCGRYKQGGELKFYCEDAKDAPVKGTGETGGTLNWKANQSYDGGDGNCKTSSRETIATKEKPAFWKMPAVESSSRDFCLSWNCCPECKKKSVIAGARPFGAGTEKRNC